jgi:predicted nucleotidyltransferase
VDAPSILTKKELQFLKELTRNRVRFILVGLSAAALQGAPVVTQDVDLWFEDLTDQGIRKALIKVGGALVPQMGLNLPMFAGDSVKLFDIVLTMHGLGRFTDEWQFTQEVTLEGVSVRILKLERIIISKEAANRPKDALVLPVLRDVLETIRRSEKR